MVIHRHYDEWPNLADLPKPCFSVIVNTLIQGSYTQNSGYENADKSFLKNLLKLFQVGPVDKLKINGFLYGIIILSITGGHFL